MIGLFLQTLPFFLIIGLGYGAGRTGFINILATVVVFVRKSSVEEAAVEAQGAVIGNVGFLGMPMLVLLIGSG